MHGRFLALSVNNNIYIFIYLYLYIHIQNLSYSVLVLVFQSQQSLLHSPVCTPILRMNHQLPSYYLMLVHMQCCSICTNLHHFSPASGVVIRSATLQCIFMYVVLHSYCARPSLLNGRLWHSDFSLNLTVEQLYCSALTDLTINK